MNNVNNKIPVITIDGPSGTGKGTICHKLASALQWHYLDSGAIYRAVAWKADKENISSDDVDALVDLSETMDIRFEIDNSLYSHTFSLQEEISEAIRTEKCSQKASIIAAHPKVRMALLERQRSFAKAPGLVCDGRDMGTVVFPTANIKIYLDASLEERAQRRYLQLKNNQNDVNLALVISQLAERDRRDIERKAAPLKAADDAICVNTDDKTIMQVFNEVMQIVHDRLMGGQ